MFKFWRMNVLIFYKCLIFNFWRMFNALFFPTRIGISSAKHDTAESIISLFIPELLTWASFDVVPSTVTNCCLLPVWQQRMVCHDGLTAKNGLSWRSDSKEWSVMTVWKQRKVCHDDPTAKNSLSWQSDCKEQVKNLDVMMNNTATFTLHIRNLV